MLDQIKITRIPESQQVISTAKFPKSNKDNSIECYYRQLFDGNYNEEKIKVQAFVVVSFEQYDFLKENFLKPSDWHENIGGSFTDDPYFDNYTQEEFEKAVSTNPEALKIFRETCYSNCVAVVEENTGWTLYINTEGYSYARYVGFGERFEIPEIIDETKEPENITEHWDEAKDKIIHAENILRRYDSPEAGNFKSWNAYVNLTQKEIRVYGWDKTRRTDGEKTFFDRVFKLGDKVEYDSWNLSYLGDIVAIGAKTVTIEGSRKKRLRLGEFIDRNRYLDLEETAKRNHETSMCI